MQSKTLVSTFTIAMIAATSCVSTAAAGGYGGNTGSAYSQQREQVRPRVPAHTVYKGGNRHLQWCYDRYRSYRQQDNTFQPYAGPREACISPHVEDRLKLFAPRHAPDERLRDRAAIDLDPARGDRFGNLPESIPAVDNPENATPQDPFGNLPETLDVGPGASGSVREAPQQQAPQNVSPLSAETTANENTTDGDRDATEELAQDATDQQPQNATGQQPQTATAAPPPDAPGTPVEDVAADPEQEGSSQPEDR